MSMCTVRLSFSFVSCLQKSSHDELKQQLAKVFEEKHKSELASKVHVVCVYISLRGGGSDVRIHKKILTYLRTLRSIKIKGIVSRYKA